MNLFVLRVCSVVLWVSPISSVNIAALKDLFNGRFGVSDLFGGAFGVSDLFGPHLVASDLFGGSCRVRMFSVVLSVCQISALVLLVFPIFAEVLSVFRIFLKSYFGVEDLFVFLTLC
jgi:hypothetical protein